jgi:hypothetical protein
MGKERESVVIGIPLGTRLSSVVLVGGETHVWIALKKRVPKYTDWEGTYLRIEPNGRVTRVTVGPDVPVDDEFIIKEKDND